jgi:hypothetical protein
MQGSHRAPWDKGLCAQRPSGRKHIRCTHRDRDGRFANEDETCWTPATRRRCAIKTDRSCAATPVALPPPTSESAISKALQSTKLTPVADGAYLSEGVAVGRLSVALLRLGLGTPDLGRLSPLANDRPPRSGRLSVALLRLGLACSQPIWPLYAKHDLSCSGVEARGACSHQNRA